MGATSRKRKQRLRKAQKENSRVMRKTAREVADRLLGKRSSFMPGSKEWEDLNWQRLCKDHNK